MVGGDVVFTVTATNPTTEVAPDVVVFEALPPKLTWTVPPSACSVRSTSSRAAPSATSRAAHHSSSIFSATPPVDVCGAFTNYALTTSAAGGLARRLVIVDVPCPPDPQPPEPLILMTKEPSSTRSTVPGPSPGS